MAISVATPVEAARLAPPLRGLVRAALGTQGRTPGEIAVVLSDDATLRVLNRGYRGIARTTDVLSFEYDDGPEAGIPKRQARARGRSPCRPARAR